MALYMVGVLGFAVNGTICARESRCRTCGISPAVAISKRRPRQRGAAWPDLEDDDDHDESENYQVPTNSPTISQPATWPDGGQLRRDDRHIEAPDGGIARGVRAGELPVAQVPAGGRRITRATSRAAPCEDGSTL